MLDAGISEKCLGNDVPSLSVRLAEIDVWEIGAPVPLVGTISGEGQIVTPMAQVENEVVVEALASPVDHLISSIILEASKNRIHFLPQAAITDDLQLPRKRQPIKFQRIDTEPHIDWPIARTAASLC